LSTIIQKKIKNTRFKSLKTAYKRTIKTIIDLIVRLFVEDIVSANECVKTDNIGV